MHSGSKGYTVLLDSLILTFNTELHCSLVVSEELDYKVFRSARNFLVGVLELDGAKLPDSGAPRPKFDTRDPSHERDHRSSHSVGLSL